MATRKSSKPRATRRVAGVPVSSPYHTPLATPQQAFLAAYVSLRDAGLQVEADRFLASVEPRPVGGIGAALKRAENAADYAASVGYRGPKRHELNDRLLAIQDLIRRF